MFSKKQISLFLILLVGFIDVMGIGLVYPMFASMIFQPGSTLISPEATDTYKGVWLGFLLAAMPLTQFFSSPILGMLSDHKGRKKILIPSLAVGVVGYLIAMWGVWNSSLILLLISRIVIGISAGTGAIVSAALADISSQEEKAKNFALLNMACGLGFTIGPCLGGILSAFGYAFPFLFAGLVTLLNCILAYIYFEETFAPKEAKAVSFYLGIINIKKAFQSGTLRAVFSAAFLACFGWSFYWEFTPVTWIDIYGFTTAEIGNFYAYGALVYAFSCGLLIRPILNCFSNQVVFFWALILCGLFIGLLSFHANELWLWALIPLQQFSIALFWPAVAAVISNSVSEDIQGEMLGVLQSMEALAFAVSPIIAGPLLGLSVLMPMIVGAVAMFLGAAILRMQNSS